MDSYGSQRRRACLAIRGGGGKALRREVEAIGGDIILITHEAFPERFKPAKHDFDLCSAGRLLIVALGRPPATPLSREICLAMNALASDIVNYTF